MCVCVCVNTIFAFLAHALHDRLSRQLSELSRLATNIECIDQLMDLLRVQNSMDEILGLIGQVTSSQVHGKLAELLQTLLHVSCPCFRRRLER